MTSDIQGADLVQVPQVSTLSSERLPVFAHIQVLGFRVDKVSQAQALEWAQIATAIKRPRQVITANPLMLLAALKDAVLGDIINTAALVVPESSGIFWASQQLGTPLKTFVPGIDLFLGLCDLARDTGRTVFLLGAKPGIAEQAAGKLWAMFPGLRIVGTHHGYFLSPNDEQTAIDRVKTTQPDFLFVAMSVPHQEKWIRSHLVGLHASVIMGVGGSFDVISGGLKRAPLWMRNLGLEWLFRTAQQPWRLKRVIHLPVFAWKILRS